MCLADLHFVLTFLLAWLLTYLVWGSGRRYHLGKCAILLKMTVIKNNVLRSQPFREVYQSFLLDLV